MTKKLLPLMSIILIAAFALTACATATPTATEVPTTAPITTKAATTAPTTIPTLKGTITLWQGWTEAEITSLNAVIAAFQTKNPDVKFNVLYVPFNDLRGKFETSASTGGGPSVLIGAADWGPAEFKANLIADLMKDVDSTFLGTINPAALGAVQYKGALIGLPESIKGVVMFRNKSIIADAPTSFDDLVAKAKAATKGDIKGAYLEYGLFFSAGDLTALGGNLMTTAGDPAFNDAKGVAWVNEIKRYQEAGPVSNNTDDDINLFKTGKIGIVIDGTWNASALAGAIGASNLVIDPWPTNMSGYVQTENIYLSANVKGDDRAASVAFMKYFLSPEAQGILADVGTKDSPKAGHIPSISGVTVSDPLENMAVTAFKGGVAFPVIPEMGAYWTPVNNALLQAVQQNADAATVLKTANDAVVAALPAIRK